jgi:hypothetical protein
MFRELKRPEDGALLLQYRLHELILRARTQYGRRDTLSNIVLKRRAGLPLKSSGVSHTSRGTCRLPRMG